MRIKPVLALTAMALVVTSCLASSANAAEITASSEVTESSEVTQASCTGHSRFALGTTQYRVRPTTSAASGDINCVLGIGSSGSGVYHLQFTLNKCYGQHIDVDSVYGEDTANAVRNAQTWEGANPDGTFGPETNLLMMWPVYRNSDGVLIDCK